MKSERARGNARFWWGGLLGIAVLADLALVGFSGRPRSEVAMIGYAVLHIYPAVAVGTFFGGFIATNRPGASAAAGCLRTVAAIVLGMVAAWLGPLFIYALMLYTLR